MTTMLHPTFAAALEPFAPKPAVVAAPKCAECGKAIENKRFNSVCSAKCWQALHMGAGVVR